MRDREAKGKLRSHQGRWMKGIRAMAHSIAAKGKSIAGCGTMTVAANMDY